MTRTMNDFEIEIYDDKEGLCGTYLVTNISIEKEEEVRTLCNGDPGYPGSWECDYDHAHISGDEIDDNIVTEKIEDEIYKRDEERDNTEEE